MQKNNFIKIIEDSGIRATATRIFILREISKIKDTFSLGDLEESLPTIDKSTIYRTLTTLLDHNLIQKIDDGSGAMKYCICRNLGECEEEEEYHCHFYCEKCNKTYCLDQSAITNINLPKGYTMNQINYIITGKCNKCNNQT